MPRTTIAGAPFVLVTLAAVCSLWVEPGHAQGLPKPSPSAKACAFLPVADLEAHFGAKAQNVQGLDQSTRNTCSARFPDLFHVALVESHPPSAADQAMTAAQRLGFLKQAMREVKDTRDFGAVGCFRSAIDMGKPVQDTTCFVAQAAYLALSIQSIDPKQVSFEAVKGLLEKAAARRK
jgi:hypothetical protein